MIGPEHVEAAAKALLTPKTFRVWIMRGDPALRWPPLAWMSFALCLGIVLGVLWS